MKLRIETQYAFSFGAKPREMNPAMMRHMKCEINLCRLQNEAINQKCEGRRLAAAECWRIICIHRLQLIDFTLFSLFIMSAVYINTCRVMNWIFTYSQHSPVHFMPQFQEVLTKIPERTLALPPPGHAHSLWINYRAWWLPNSLSARLFQTWND